MEPKDYRLAAVMFTDIVGFSRMMEEDEVGTLQTLDFHNKLVREQVVRFRGTVIKTIGDAFLAQFQTTLDAVQCSLAVQEGISEYNEANLGKPLTLRIGVHLGDIYFYENDALGEGINIASRLQSLSKPGHITISREVYSQVSGKIPMKVEAMGQVHLKNITREVHAYEIIPGGEDNNSNAYRKAHQAAQEPRPEPQAEVPRGPSGPLRDPLNPPPRFRDLKEEWKSLKDQLKEEVKAEVGGDRGDWKSLRRELRHRYRHGGSWDGALPVDPAAIVAQVFRDPINDLKNEDGTPASAFQIYKRKKLRAADQARGGFRGHLIPFVAVNAGLFYINQNDFAKGGTYPWFLYPLLGWGIGLASHWASLRGTLATARELDQIPDASAEELDIIKKYQSSRNGLYSHVASNVMVSALLVTIGYINNFDDPSWLLLKILLIPVAAMALGVFGHLSGFLARRFEFKKLWKSLKAGGPRPSKKVKADPVPEAPADPLVKKARTLRDSIVAQAAGMKGGNPFGDDMTVTLDNYVLQIGELSAIEQELGRVILSFNPADLVAEEASLRSKVAATGSETLRQEYGKSLAEVEKQKKSFDDLAEQQEILNLRIKSALGNLQQMQIDLARIKGLSDGQKEGHLLSIKERSEELSRYIEDYREGLKEIPG